MTVRKREAMIKFVADALDKTSLRTAYDARPPYQRNDYLRWIKEAKTDETKQRRLDQMLAELKDGGTYMKMEWKGDV